MLKTQKWLATGHLGFLKLFGNFYKIPWYFYQSKKKQNYRKRRKEENRGFQPNCPPDPSGLGPAHLHFSSSSPSPEAARCQPKSTRRRRCHATSLPGSPCPLLDARRRPGLAS